MLPAEYERGHVASQARQPVCEPVAQEKKGVSPASQSKAHRRGPLSRDSNMVIDVVIRRRLSGREKAVKMPQSSIN